jgi:hypothetical protein
MVAKIVLAETYRENGLPFGQMFSASSAARNIVARKNLPEFLDNMLTWMVPLRKLFIKCQNFFRKETVRQGRSLTVCRYFHEQL